MFFFPTDIYYFILVVPAIILAGIAQARVSSTFAKYNRIQASSNLTGAQAAREILDQHNLSGVRIEHISGRLSDHYDPRSKVIRLSDSVYSSKSIAAIGVAAHEVGHAIQHATDYAPLKVRSAIIPVTNIGSMLSIPLIMFGIFLNTPILIQVGIIAFASVTVFQLITLPVEFDASTRALQTLSSISVLRGEQELTGAKNVLNAAALTYVAALLVSVMQLLRLIILFGGRRDD